MNRALVPLALGLLAGCATAGEASPGSRPASDVAAAAEGAPATAAPMPPPAPAPICTARLGGDRLRRSAVVRTIDAGLGAWLQTVSIDPKVDRGHFRGWIVRSLPAGDACYRDVDLRENDLVTRVNGHSIEHPEDAHAIWLSLRTSSELVVDFVRNDETHTLKFTIVDQ